MSVVFRIGYHRNVFIIACVTMLLVDRPSVSIAALLRKRNNVVLFHCYATGRRRHAAKETSHIQHYHPGIVQEAQGRSAEQAVSPHHNNI
jgi:hypothetical protein